MFYFVLLYRSVVIILLINVCVTVGNLIVLSLWLFEKVVEAVE